MNICGSPVGWEAKFQLSPKEYPSQGNLCLVGMKETLWQNGKITNPILWDCPALVGMRKKYLNMDTAVAAQIVKQLHCFIREPEPIWSG